jgi:two-component system sensor histidine kinase/response regulator
MVLQSKKILIVEDDLITAIALKNILKQERNDNVIIVNNSYDAIKSIKENSPDLVLMDINIEGDVDGIDTAKNLNQIADIPIIFITGAEDNESLDRVKQLSPYGFVLKPFKNKELIMIIELAFVKHQRKIEMEQMLKEKSQLIEELTETKQKLILYNAQKDKFLSIIAHDLRSPFQGLLGMTELIFSEIDNFSKTEIKDSLSEMNKNLTNILSLLENLLEWAKTQNETIKVEKKKFLFNDIVSYTLDYLKSNLTKKNITIKNELKKEYFVYADERMIETVTRNLISNAIKYTPTNGEITIQASTINFKILEIDIIDNGIGMPKDVLDNLFQINKNVKRPGTDGESSSGLGLLLCKEFVEKNNGKISATSFDGKGSTFRFSVPVYYPEILNFKFT